jgi:molecular chaperone DnaJ
VVIHVKQHDLFERRGDDLLCDVPITYESAALGGEVKVPTLDGYAKLKLAAGTPSGKVFRLRGKGLPNVEGYGRGDLHARVVVEVPRKVGSAYKKLLKQLADIDDAATYPERDRFGDRVDAFYERRDAMKEQQKKQT